MSLSVIVPTITGREDSLARTIRAYSETCESELIIIRDRKNWPTACNAGAELASGDVLHFGADDLVPLPGWADEVLELLAHEDELFNAKVLNYSEDGPFDNEGDGADGAETLFTRVPIMRRDQYERIGPWPDMDYAADIWVPIKGRSLGIPTRMLHSYAFVHHWHQHGRLDSPERLARSNAKLNALVGEL